MVGEDGQVADLLEGGPQARDLLGLRGDYTLQPRKLIRERLVNRDVAAMSTHALNALMLRDRLRHRGGHLALDYLDDSLHPRPMGVQSNFTLARASAFLP